MRKTANRIIRMRKKRENNELDTFRQIDQLLEEVEAPTQSQPKPLPAIVSKIPESAPGFDLFDLQRVNWIFSEADLSPMKFVSADATIFGRPVSELQIATFRDFLLSRIYVSVWTLFYCQFNFFKFL